MKIDIIITNYNNNKTTTNNNSRLYSQICDSVSGAEP